jgi:hypothetical protein
MDVSKLIRDKDKVRACVKLMPDRSLVALKGCKIYIPTRYAERGLAEIGIKTYTIGIMAWTVDDKYYSVWEINAMCQLTPTSTVKTWINDDEYYEFYFEPGSTVLKSIDLVKVDTLTFKIYDEMFSKGRIPWFLSYDDMGMIFDTADKHAGAKVGKNREVTELMVSLIARQPQDRHMLYRHVKGTLAEMKKTLPAFIALRNVTYSATNTVNKLGGSYFEQGVISALNSPSQRVEPIEDLLRR